MIYSPRTLRPHVYVSVLNWNSPRKTIRCLKSLRSLEYDNYRVFVVDNDSSDDSVRRIRAAAPEAEIIRSGENLGYAGGNRLALARAREDNADLLWILNNDTVVRADTLSQLVDAYEDHGEALYGSVPLQADGASVAFVPRDLAGARQRFQFLTCQDIAFDDLFPKQQTQEVTMLSGSSLLMPIPLIEKHGFMDPSFFMYAEETEYCFRLSAAGVPSIIVPASIVTHDVRGSAEGNAKLRAILSYYLVRNRLVTTWQHEGILWYIGIFLKDLVWILIALLMWFSRGLGSLFFAYYTLLGLRDALLMRSGKTLAPEDYLD